MINILINCAFTKHTCSHCPSFSLHLSFNMGDPFGDDEFGEFDLNFDHDLFNIPNEALLGGMSTDKNTDSDQKRCGPMMTSSQLNQKFKNSVPKKTRQQNAWNIRVWTDWASNRNKLAATLSDEHYTVPVEFNHNMAFDTLDYWPARFVFEIRREDGKLYPQRTLEQICSGIQRHLRQDCNRAEVDFF